MRRGVGEKKKAKILIPLTWNQDGLLASGHILLIVIKPEQVCYPLP